MSVVQALLLGILQGLTEFIPVSSSGHLVLAHRLLGTKAGVGGLAFDVVLHVGTLAAIVVYFRKDVREVLFAIGGLFRRNALKEEGVRLLLFVMLATVPTGAVGLALRGPMESLRATHLGWLFYLTCGLLIINGAMLSGSDLLRGKGKQLAAVPIYFALIVGLAQGVAVLPGISRSGATVVAAVAVGFSRWDAARVSFLCAIPAIAGAGLVELISSREEVWGLGLGPMSVGVAAAFAVGLAAIYFLIKVLRKAELRYFGLYCAGVALVALVVLR